MRKLCTVKKEFSSSLEVMKSTFISFLVPLNDNDINEILNRLRKEYPKARHICYAYIKQNGESKFSDDGEPSGTAGKPLYNLLLNNNLVDCMICVVRIFGGVLLGSGRLLRTYVASAQKTIEMSTVFEIYEDELINLSCNLKDINSIKGYLSKNKFEIEKIDYDEISDISFYANENALNVIKDIFYGMILSANLTKVKRMKEVSKNE